MIEFHWAEPEVQQVQRRLSGALDACNDLGRAYADLVIASDREAAKLRGAYDMAAESRELWKQRALDAGYRPETLADQAVRADIEAMRTGAWNPIGSDGQRASLGEAVGQALGSASMAWADVAGAGLFDEAWCGKVYDGLMAYLSDWAHEAVKQANEATASKLAALAPHQARRDSDVEAFIKRHRERQRDGTGQATGAFWAIDDILDDYREHADTGTSLDDKVQGPHPEG